ncbi:MAG: hypothetical protein WCI22_16285, partial [Actinomycetota bacterium]
MKERNIRLTPRMLVLGGGFLGAHTVAALTPEQTAVVEDVLAEAREHYRANGLIADEEWAPYMAALEAADLP